MQLGGDLHFRLDRVTREDRGWIADLVVAIGHDVGIETLSAEDQPRAYGEGQVAMGNRPLERLGLAEFRIRVVAGDKVKLEMSPYDLTKGRIVYRYK